MPAGAARTVTVTVRLTGAEAADVDRARGAQARADWIRGTALEAARPQRREPGKACPPHPKRRVLKGLCGACGRYVGDEKTA